MVAVRSCQCCAGAGLSPRTVEFSCLWHNWVDSRWPKCIDSVVVLQQAHPVAGVHMSRGEGGTELSSVSARWTMESRGRRGICEGAGRLTGSYARGMALLVFALVVGLLIAAAANTTRFGSHAVNPASSVPQRSSSGLSTLPAPAEAAVSRGLGADQPRFWAHRPPAGELVARNQPQRLSATFSGSGIAIATSAGDVSLSLHGFGYGERLRGPGSAALVTNRNRVSYVYPGLTEWYANGPAGLEQGFTLRAAPKRTAAGPLTLALSLRGSLRARLSPDAQSATLLAGGRSAFRYGALSVIDANGRHLRSWLSLKGGVLSLRIDDAGARYPLSVDPLVQAAELTASDGTFGELGDSVAVSGSTIVVGAPLSNAGSGSNTFEQGKVYVYTEPSGGWANATETTQLTSPDTPSDAHFGTSVAISEGM